MTWCFYVCRIPSCILRFKIKDLYPVFHRGSRRKLAGAWFRSIFVWLSCHFRPFPPAKQTAMPPLHDLIRLYQICRVVNRLYSQVFQKLFCRQAITTQKLACEKYFYITLLFLNLVYATFNKPNEPVCVCTTSPCVHNNMLLAWWKRDVNVFNFAVYKVRRV